MLNRRQVLQLLGTAAGASFLPYKGKSAITQKPAEKLIYCLNMASIRGHKLGFIKEIETAGKAGFGSVEIWMDSLQTYLKNGGSIKEAKSVLNNSGVKVEGAIGFAEWIVDDDARRNKGVEQLKKEMELLAEIGCQRTAAPPMGATTEAGLNLDRAAERYRAILELGDQTGVVPNLELWGFSKNLGKIGEVFYVALQSGHPSAKVLLDVYHLYKGGSSIETLHLIGEQAVEILHVNDYPANLSPAMITDADRIYPGDGVAPVGRILKGLRKTDMPLIISFEAFNKNYYNQDALLVAKTALAKMKAITSANELQS